MEILRSDYKITARQVCCNYTCWIWSWSRTSLWTTGRFFFLMADTTGSNQFLASTWLISKQHRTLSITLGIIDHQPRGSSQHELIEPLLYRLSAISLSTRSSSTDRIHRYEQPSGTKRAGSFFTSISSSASSLDLLPLLRPRPTLPTSDVSIR